MKKGVSIIIPVYNREKLIGSCLKSIFEQDYSGEFEIIVSDDGSTDKSLDIARSFGEKVRVLEKPVDCNLQGASGARNRGIAAARYSYIAFLDSDDYYLPGHIKRMVDFLDENQEIGFAFCRSKQEVINYNGEIVRKDWTRRRVTFLDVNYIALFRSNCINTNTIVVRKEVFETVGVFNTSYSNGEDGDLWIRIGEKFKAGFIDSFGAVYRVEHQNGQLTENNSLRIRECAKSVFLQAFVRSYTSESKDGMRLFLIIRMLMYLRKTGHKNAFNRILNHIFIATKLFVLYPVTSIKFLFYYLY